MIELLPEFPPGNLFLQFVLWLANRAGCSPGATLICHVELAERMIEDARSELERVVGPLEIVVDDTDTRGAADLYRVTRFDGTMHGAGTITVIGVEERRQPTVIW